MLVLAGLAALSCAGPQKSAEAPERDRRVEEIIAFDSEIRTFRQELGLPPQPEKKYFPPNEIAWSTAPTPASAECKEVCNLAEHICSNKDEICKIAGEMPDDAWAKGKCDSAKASCNEANERCLNCEK
jgi:hypothetical protein